MIICTYIKISKLNRKNQTCHVKKWSKFTNNFNNSRILINCRKKFNTHLLF